ncbi:MAG TPA: hypothetical protein VFQ44_31200 [Streptosporangiaceae bacterium]|nr:hypothetical protein [Streptosporangiaceae bacterium]
MAEHKVRYAHPAQGLFILIVIHTVLVIITAIVGGVISDRIGERKTASDRAKDLGIINIAIVGPAAVAGALSAALVSLGGYPTLFAATAIVAAAGSVLVWRIKSVP